VLQSFIRLKQGRVIGRTPAKREGKAVEVRRFFHQQREQQQLSLIQMDL
jgi:hypothetical protein